MMREFLRDLVKFLAVLTFTLAGYAGYRAFGMFANAMAAGATAGEFMNTLAGGAFLTLAMIALVGMLLAALGWLVAEVVPKADVIPEQKAEKQG